MSLPYDSRRATIRHAAAKPTRDYHRAQVVSKLTMNPRRDAATLASLARSHKMTVEEIEAIDRELAAR